MSTEAKSTFTIERKTPKQLSDLFHDAAIRILATQPHSAKVYDADSVECAIRRARHFVERIIDLQGGVE